MVKTQKTLSKKEIERYNRQMLLPNWGKTGQKKLKAAHVVVVGAGGLGCPAALYLAAAGVGKLTIIDKDQFELSNLNRQILGWQNDIDRFKAEAVAEKLSALNPEITIHPLVLEISAENIGEIIQDANVIVDAMDNWKTRFIINKECVKRKIPFIHAGIFGLYGQMMPIIPGKSPCLSCLLPKTPKEISKFPVLGVTPAIFAMLQVMETIKLIVGLGETLIGKMLLFDGETMNFTVINIERNPKCPICAHI
jgi:molybdopterin/thiamine biosynthesis adenylyltransferase